MNRPGMRAVAGFIFVTAASHGVIPAIAASQTTTGVRSGRAAIEALRFEPLDFEQPDVRHVEVAGIDVLHLEDRSLPLVTVRAYFRGCLLYTSDAADE